MKKLIFILMFLFCAQVWAQGPAIPKRGKMLNLGADTLTGYLKSYIFFQDTTRFGNFLLLDSIPTPGAPSYGQGILLGRGMSGLRYVKPDGSPIDFGSGSGITTLNGLSASTQTFATGTTGTDFGIVSSSSTHTFNLPTASGTNRGLLQSSDFTAFNNKQATITVLAPVVLTGAQVSVDTSTGNTHLATQAALSLKANSASPTFTGTITTALGAGTVRSSSGGVLSSTASDTVGLASALAGKQATISVTSPITLTGASVGMVNQGTTGTVLHGNAGGNPSFAAVALATEVTGTLQATNFPALAGDVTTSAGSLTTAIGAGKVTNAMLAGSIDAANINTGIVSNTEFNYLDGVTSALQTQLNAKQATISVTAPITLSGASVGIVNQGTTITLLHGNAAGNATFGAVSLTADVTGILPIANIATGTPDGTKFVRDDGTLAVPAGGGGGAPTTATYITQTSDATLSAEQALGLLSTGIMQSTTSTGVVSTFSTSAGLASAISDETGSSGGGLAVFSNAPTFTTNARSPLWIADSNATGLEIHNRADQTTNYEKGYAKFNASVFLVGFANGGTGTARIFRLSGASGANPSTLDIRRDAFPWFSFSGGSTAGAGTMVALAASTSTLASGNSTQVSISPTITQSSTAGFTSLLINPTITSAGTGTSRLIDAQSNGTSKFNIDTLGTITTKSLGAGTVRSSSGGVLSATASDTVGLGTSLAAKQATISVTAPITLSGASVGIVNQGTTTTLLHGNASGNASFSAVSLTADVSGTLPIANGGTNGTTALAGFNNLSPVTTRGDLITRDATNNIRLAIGTSGKFLRTDGTDPSWQNVAASDVTSGAALTKVDDTNVTLTLGGTPSTALIAASSITAGWTGQLSVARGGTGSSSFTSGSIPYSNGTILTQDNANLFWDASGSRLHLGKGLDLLNSSSGYANLTLSDTSGGADNSIFNAWKPLKWFMTHGSTGSPVTSAGSTVKIVRTQQIPLLSVNSNKADDEATSALAVYNFGTATDSTQAVGGSFHARTVSTVGSGGGGGSTDALGLLAIAQVKNGAKGGATGIYSESRYDTTGAFGISAEIRGTNFISHTTKSNIGSATTGDTTMGLWITSRGNTGREVNTAIGIASPWGQNWQYGLVLRPSSTDSISILDNSSSAQSIVLNGTHTNSIITGTTAGNVGIGVPSPTMTIETNLLTSGTYSRPSLGASSPDNTKWLYILGPANGSGTAHIVRSSNLSFAIGHETTKGGGTFTTDATWDANGQLGIGDATPAALLTVGNGDLFQVNSSGDIAKINNVAYAFPASQGGASTVLTNNGSGTLTWAAGGSGITTLNTLTGATQTFATGTSGTDFGIVSSGTTHTFNIPTSDLNNRGLLSAADWSSFNGRALQTTTITVAGTTNQIASSAGAQNLASNRMWTLSLPSSVVFPGTIDVGAAKFTVNGTGNITKINNITTSFPSAQGNAGGYIENDGTGTLSWADHEPSRVTKLFDDFVANTAAGNTGWTFTASSGEVVIDTTVAAYDSTHAGIIRLGTVALPTGMAFISQGTKTLSASGGVIVNEVDVRILVLNAVGQRFIVAVGLGDITTNAQHNNGIYFEYGDSTSAFPLEWWAVTANNGTRQKTRSNITVAAATWYRLRTETNTTGTSVTYYINGTNVATITSQIPVGSARLCAPNVKISKFSGTVGRSLEVDYYWLRKRVSIQR